MKPATGTRGIGHIVIASNDVNGLQRIANAAPKLDFIYDEETNEIIDIAGASTQPDRVAQLLITKPLLVLNRKFDLRVFVLVRSFVPFEAYLHDLFYARLANKAYKEANIECDDEAVLTVSAYNADEEIAKKQHRLSRRKLRFALENEARENGRTLDWTSMMESIRNLCSELFSNSAEVIGSWPYSSAMYGVDIIFDDSASMFSYANAISNNNNTNMNISNNTCDTIDNCNKKSTISNNVYNTNAIVDTPVAKLLEVNFMPDWSPCRASCLEAPDSVSNENTPSHPDEMGFIFNEWVEDVMECLATTSNLENHPRLKLL